MRTLIIIQKIYSENFSRLFEGFSSEPSWITVKKIGMLCYNFFLALIENYAEMLTKMQVKSFQILQEFWLTEGLNLETIGERCLGPQNALIVCWVSKFTN